MKTLQFTTTNKNLFCPLTGIQLICEELGFKPSPALVFCYVDMEEVFEFATPKIQELYDECKEIVLADNQTTYDVFASKVHQENWLCLHLFDENSEEIRLCFDMNYKIK
jgi:hypothetical protein